MNYGKIKVLLLVFFGLAQFIFNSCENVKAKKTVLKDYKDSFKIYSETAQLKADAPVRGFNFCGEYIPSHQLKHIKAVEKHIRYVKLYKHSFNPTKARAKHWLPIIKRIVKSYGLPEDLAYLPVVESKLKNGNSRKGAVGFWQLMPETAKECGLKVEVNKALKDTANADAHLDERLDPIKSTHAACKLLKRMHRDLGDWPLTIAAYNCGLGKTKQRIAESKLVSPSFYDLHFNTETTNYVHRLYAIKTLIKTNRSTTKNTLASK